MGPTPEDLNPTPPAPPTGSPQTITVVEPQAPPAAPPQTEGRFSAADLERARTEEKEKLYTRLNKSEERFSAMESELTALRQEREQRQSVTEAEANAQAEADQKKRESELSAKKLLEETRADFESRFAALQSEREVEKAALEKEAEFNRLRGYAQEKVAAARDEIAPELLDLVSGNSQEEIDASIELLKAKTTAILENVQQGQQQIRSTMRGVQPTGFTGLGPMDNESGLRHLSANDIKNMSMTEYQRYRAQLIGEKAARNDPRRSDTGVGLFG